MVQVAFALALLSIGCASSSPTFIGMHSANEGGIFISAVTEKSHWVYDQTDICKWPTLSYTSLTFGNHQAAFARSRGFLYKGIGLNNTWRVLRITVSDLSCELLPSSAHLPFTPGEFWIDFFPDQSSESPKPTVVGALQDSPSSVYSILKLEEEFSKKPRITEWMDVHIPHQVRQIFGSYYDSEKQIVYVGFNEGHLFWDVPPSWLLVVDVANKKVVSQMFNEHLGGFDIWFDFPSDSFYVLTDNDCSPNCSQGVRKWTPDRQKISDVKSNFCHGAACFIFQVGYGYSYNTANSTAVIYGGVSGYWHYSIMTGELGQFEYDTVFPSNAVYVGPLHSTQWDKR